MITKSPRRCVATNQCQFSRLRVPENSCERIYFRPSPLRLARTNGGFPCLSPSVPKGTATGSLPAEYSLLYLFTTKKLFDCRILERFPAMDTALVRSLYESRKQRMRLQRLRLELGMELAAEEEWVTGNFNDFDVSSVGR